MKIRSRGMYPPHPHGHKHCACEKPRKHYGKRKDRKPCAEGEYFKIMEIIKKTSVKAPVKIGDIILTNIYVTDIIATKDIV